MGCAAISVCPLMITVLLVAAPAAAQDGRPLLHLATATFAETLKPPQALVVRDPPDVSMRSLVGVHLGEGRGGFDIGGIGVALNSAAPSGNFCVRLQSDDLRYFAANEYRKEQDPTARPLIETRSTQSLALHDEFGAQDVIVRVIADARCSAAERGRIVPAIPPGAPQTDELFVYLNVDGASSIALLQNKVVMAQSECLPARSSIAAYNYLCKVKVGAANPTALQIQTLREGRLRTRTYAFLWARP